MGRAAIFPLTFALSLAFAFLARAALLPFAKKLETRYGFSREFVSELALAVPFAAAIVAALAFLTWLLA